MVYGTCGCDDIPLTCAMSVMYSPPPSLSLSGKRVELKGFQGFLGGLDNEKGMTGELSVSTEYAGLEIMFHVAPLMPYDPNDPQQVSTIRTCTCM